MTVRRVDLEPIMGGTKTIEAQVAAGLIKLEGDASVLANLASTMVHFDPRFPMMPGTKLRGTADTKAGPYEAILRQAIAE